MRGRGELFLDPRGSLPFAYPCLSLGSTECVRPPSYSALLPVFPLQLHQWLVRCIVIEELGHFFKWKLSA